MQIFKIEFLLFKKWLKEYKDWRIEKASTAAFYRAVDIAIEKYKQHPRKYYVAQASLEHYEVLGSQEIRKMRKYKVAKQDENFMKLHEVAFAVTDQNIDRLKYEQARRHRKWLYRMIDPFYRPIKPEHEKMLESLRDRLTDPQRIIDTFDRSEYVKCIDEILRRNS